MHIKRKSVCVHDKNHRITTKMQKKEKTNQQQNKTAKEENKKTKSGHGCTLNFIVFITLYVLLVIAVRYFVNF